jgi:Dimerisation domain
VRSSASSPRGLLAEADRKRSWRSWREWNVGHENAWSIDAWVLATQLISVASTLGIADVLHSGPKTTREVAAAVGADASALYRVLRALAGMGIFAERADGRFEMTPLAEPLRPDASESLHGSAELYGSKWWWDAMGALLHSVRTGQTAFETVHGLSLFEYLERTPAAAGLFNEHQANMTHQDAAATHTFSRTSFTTGTTSAPSRFL